MRSRTAMHSRAMTSTDVVVASLATAEPYVNVYTTIVPTCQLPRAKAGARGALADRAGRARQGCASRHAGSKPERFQDFLRNRAVTLGPARRYTFMVMR